MLSNMLNAVIAWMTALGGWGVFWGMAIESCGVLLPSEIVLPLGGYLAHLGHLTFWQAVWAGMGGGMLGSGVAYYIGLYGGRTWLYRFGRFLLLRQHEIDVAERWFIRHGEAVVFFGRLLPGIRTFISFPAGMAQMNFWRFFVFSFAGALPWTIAFVYLGQKLGENWHQVRAMFHNFNVIVGIILVVLFVAGVGYWLLRRRQTT